MPLTRPWFKGVTNIRGNLFSVVDFPAFLGATPVNVAAESRLLLIGDRFRMGSALLVDRSLGLRNPTQLTARPKSSQASWVKGEYVDQEGRIWQELDVPQLVQQQDFLAVAQ